MNARHLAALFCALLCAACARQTIPDISSGPGAHERPANNRTINAVLAEALDATRNKVGDPAVATSVEAFTTPDGIVIPARSRLLGRITYVRPTSSGEYQSILGMTFERAEIEGGRVVPLRADVVAIAAARNAPPPPRPPSDSTRPRPESAAGAFGDRIGGGRRIMYNNAGAARRAPRQIVRRLEAGPGSIGALDERGLLVPESRGVFGLPGMNVNQSTQSGERTSMISAILGDVHLATGTRMLLGVRTDPARKDAAARGAMP